MEYVQLARRHAMEAATRLDDTWASLAGPINPLSADFPLMRPSFAFSCGVAYLAFVLLVPPLFKAVGFSIKLKPIMRLYNVFMVLLSGYMCVMSILLARQSNDSVWCVPLASGEAGRRMATLTWIFTYSKVIEFLDSVFMVFEGRWRQLSFLHVYHHVSILSYWFAILWIAPGSDAYFSLAGNSFIHVLMYSYYLLASFEITPWWKYYITYCQILQFVSFAGQSIYVGYIKTEAVCDFPDVLSRGLLWYMLTLIVLFLNFLVKNKGKSKGRGKGTPGSTKKQV